MKTKQLITKLLALTLAISILTTSCVSSTLIQSHPRGANVYIDGQLLGKTPYFYSDSKIYNSVTKVELVKEGYEPLQTSIVKDEQLNTGAIIGGIFLLVPFLWTMQYKPIRLYELAPVATIQEETINDEKPVLEKSQYDQLRELKKLYDEKIITEEEFNNEKKKILDIN